MIIAQFNQEHKQAWFSDWFGKFKRQQAVFAADENDAQRLTDFRNRKYIYETLEKWLNQRQHALKGTAGEVKAVELLHLLNQKRNGYFTLMKAIRSKLADFKSLAPGDTRDTYKYYQNIIEPIFRHCTNQES